MDTATTGTLARRFRAAPSTLTTMAIATLFSGSLIACSPPEREPPDPQTNDTIHGDYANDYANDDANNYDRDDVTENSVTTDSYQRAENTNNDCQLTLGFDIWEPYQFIDVGDYVRGLDIEIAQTVANHMNCELNFVQATWVELLQDLQRGDVDMLMGASYTEERAEFAHFSAPYRDEQFVVFVRDEEQRNFNQQSIEAIVEAGYRLGIVDSYYYGDEFQQLYEDARDANGSEQFISALMGEFNLVRLLDRDIDGFIEDAVVGHSLIRRKGLTDYISASAVELDARDVYIMLSRETVDEHQLEAINEALAELVESGEHDMIMNRYVPQAQQ